PTTIAGGALTARIDSESPPPGNYEFRASIADVAGNRAETTLREDGEPMVLRFPLKTATRLRATLGNGKDSQVVAYRNEGEIRGRLLDPSGNPIPRQAVTVTETFEEGSLIDSRQRIVETDPDGDFRSALPGGPSRNVEVSYSGSRRYSADTEGGLDFNVRGAAQLKISKRRVKAGRPVTFRGRVKRYFARIPAGGKLVEVQVRSGDDWTTLQEATGTDSKGRITLRHRFRGFYTQPVTFAFRLKATRESGWPYRGAAKSRRQRVTVVPK
ncbi:MAG: carboxypeptidase-like regulatory domain-containing protein, partial [Solirubrobacterales bacterium]